MWLPIIYIYIYIYIEVTISSIGKIFCLLNKRSGFRTLASTKNYWYLISLMIKSNIHGADTTDLIFFFFFLLIFGNESLSDLILCNCLYKFSTSYLSKITF